MIPIRRAPSFLRDLAATSWLDLSHSESAKKAPGNLGYMCLNPRIRVPLTRLRSISGATRATQQAETKQQGSRFLRRSRIYAATSDRRNQRKGIVVYVIDYRLKDVKGAEPIYRLSVPILDPTQAPAKELAALYQSGQPSRDQAEDEQLQSAPPEAAVHANASMLPRGSGLLSKQYWG